MTENLVVDFPGWGGTRGRVLASYQATGEAAVTGFPLFYATALLAAARTIATAVRHFVTYSIRKYGSTFYIGIAMVVLPYFGLWEN